MEAGRSLLTAPSPPSKPRNPIRNQITISCTAKISQVSRKPAPSAVGNFPRAVLTQESCETYNGFYLLKEEKATADDNRLGKLRPLTMELQHKVPLEYAESELLYWSEPSGFTLADSKILQNFERGQLAPSLISFDLAENGACVTHKSAGSSVDKLKEEPHKAKFSNGVAVVRSNRLMERRLKKRRVTNIPKYTKYDNKVSNSSNGCCKLSKKMERCIDSRDRLRFFSWGFVYRKFLSREEEKEAIINIQDLIRLEEARETLKSQFNREPTRSEWAQAVGLRSGSIDSRILLGRCSLEKIVKTNFRLVLHIAKQHVGKGVDIEDLVQEGYKGLMTGLRKFKISKGCRFKAYAHWWIRHSIRKAIQENSRTIRLPVRVFDLLKKIRREKIVCIREGCEPTKEEIARRLGITTKKLSKVLWYGREPISLSDRITGYGEDVTYQEVIADPTVEEPDVTVFREIRSQHIHECINLLKPRERTIILYRFGFYGGARKSLHEIGRMFGLTKERIRQMERCALEKLKKIASSEELAAYTMFLN